MGGTLAVMVAAYLLGSVPTALVVSRLLAHGDIRLKGDGNMGARNVARQIGWGAGAVVGAVDFAKGALAVRLAREAGLSEPWQLAAGLAAVVGHDFPIWASFRGGQGMAVSLGVLSILMPLATLAGLGVFALVYLFTRAFELSASLGLGFIVGYAWWRGEPTLWVAYGALLFVAVGLKTVLDRPHREAVARQEPRRPA